MDSITSFRQIILDFPLQFAKGWDIGISTKGGFPPNGRADTSGGKVKVPLKKYSNFLLCGMGGSALPGDLIANLYGIGCVHRSYGLPDKIDVDVLIIVSSYSGNTEECLDSYKKAKKRGLPLAAITSGGKLAEMAKKDNVPLALIPGGIPPRTALGYSFACLAGMLFSRGLLSSKARLIKNLANFLDVNSYEKQGKEIAKKIGARIPLIYASNDNWVLARIWKINFNETGKSHSFWNVFPELNHNEMVGYTKVNKDNYYAIILKDKEKDHLKIQKRMDLTSNIIQKTGIPTETILLKGNNRLEKIFSSIILSNWIAYYSAALKGMDPMPVDIVEDFKRRMED